MSNARFLSEATAKVLQIILPAKLFQEKIHHNEKIFRFLDINQGFRSKNECKMTPKSKKWANIHSFLDEQKEALPRAHIDGKAAFAAGKTVAFTLNIP